MNHHHASSQRTISILLSVLVSLCACSSDESGTGSSGTSGGSTSGTADASPETPLDAGGSRDAGPDAAPVDSGKTCNWQTGLFSCGPTTGKSCSKDKDFCLVGDPTFGVACKSIGGSGSTCPSCAAVLPNVSCGAGKSPSCSGDETTGIIVKCQ